MAHRSHPSSHQPSISLEPAQDPIVAILTMMQQQMTMTQQQLEKADERWHAAEEDRCHSRLTTIRLIGMVTCCHPPKLQIGSLS